MSRSNDNPSSSTYPPATAAPSSGPGELEASRTSRCDVYLVSEPSASGARPHWFLWVPEDASDPWAYGKKVHAVGSPLTGFKLCFEYHYHLGTGCCSTQGHGGGVGRMVKARLFEGVSMMKDSEAGVEGVRHEGVYRRVEFTDHRTRGPHRSEVGAPDVTTYHASQSASADSEEGTMDLLEAAAWFVPLPPPTRIPESAFLTSDSGEPRVPSPGEMKEYWRRDHPVANPRCQEWTWGVIKALACRLARTASPDRASGRERDDEEEKEKKERGEEGEEEERERLRRLVWGVRRDGNPYPPGFRPQDEGFWEV